MEMAITIVLHKVLKDEYIVCRSNKYDDYHGVDTIIVNKRTGEVLCAFDDVHDDTEEQIYEWHKQDLVEETNKNGGQTISYCFTFENGNLVKKEMKNVPKFYMKFDYEELMKALKNIDPLNLDKISAAEYEIYNTIIATLKSQISGNKEKGSAHPEYIKNMEAFEALIPGLEQRGQAA
jgi:hypothetical protein